MAAKYVNVTQSEMEDHLFPQGFKQIFISGTTELVYGKRVDRDELMLTLRVYTGINSGGNSREKGADAMRVTIFQKIIAQNEQVLKMVGGSKRVHRVEGWRKNLQSRIDAWEDLLGPQCQCGGLMVERDGRNGKFYGCVNYPLCKSTLSIGKVAV